MEVLVGEGVTFIHRVTSTYPSTMQDISYKLMDPNGLFLQGRSTHRLTYKS